MARPSEYAEWALLDQVDPTSGQNNVVTPPAAWKNYGWSYQEKPPRNYDNWRGRMVDLWIKYLDATCARPATYIVAAVDASDESKAHADAVCDGTNDEVQIQAAITAVAVTGGLVLLTEGTFTILDGITLDSSVHLRGRGRGATVIKVAATASSDFNILSVTSKTILSVRDLSIDGTGGSVAQNHRGIYLDSSSHIVLADLLVENIAYDASNGQGVHIAASTQVLMERVESSNAGSTGLEISGASHSCEVVNCIFDNCDAYGVNISATYCALSACSIRANASTGLIVSGNYNTFQVEVRDNVGHGISLSGSYNVVSRCMVSGNDADGINLTAGDENIVAGNMIVGNSQGTDDTNDGISIDADSDNNLIVNNMVRHGGGAAQHKYGIDVAGSPNSSAISNNDLRNSGKTAATNGTAKTVPEWVGSAAGTNVQDDITKANRVA